MLIHASSDGPNTNLIFLRVLTEKCYDQELNQLIDLGTCGFHTPHNAFKHGEKKIRLGTQKTDVIYEQNIS